MDEVAKRIAGEIALSERPGDALKKWREIFGVTQTEVSRAMGVTSSVISDYEKGKRSPGSNFIRRYVNALIEIDRNRGWVVVSSLAQKFLGISTRTIDLWDYKKAVKVADIVTSVKGHIVTSHIDPEEIVYGYMVIDSLRTIEEMDSKDFMVLMGMSYRRVVVFTRVESGRSPMVAIRVSQLKPSLVVLHRPTRLDRLGVRIAEKEGITLIVSLHPTVSTLIESLRRLDA
ncbi:helix-turn-helix domain-containing protein [Ignicoccus islandicus]|uniref:helix-turn-helix domain-containing protein n=1 Tax=Ignicoccus islandicus TaxID=54259 RepID=UPI001C2749C4|nr:helix-turn-helix domain-containing protein [Ignicoccus islandicus]